MTTIQQIFDMAIHLMDEQQETGGSTATTDTQEYKFRTLSILTAVLPSVYIYSDTCDYSGKGRPHCPGLKLPEHYSNPDFTQTSPVDDTISMGILPYALAGHLLAGENESLSRFFMERYLTALGDLRNKIPGEFQPISTPYGTF